VLLKVQQELLAIRVLGFMFATVQLSQPDLFVLSADH
jgi:hypothetical protein